jgi:hypothetical protein
MAAITPFNPYAQGNLDLFIQNLSDKLDRANVLAEKINLQSEDLLIKVDEHLKSRELRYESYKKILDEINTPPKFCVILKISSMVTGFVNRESGNSNYRVIRLACLIFGVVKLILFPATWVISTSYHKLIGGRESYQPQEKHPTRDDVRLE